MSVLINFKICDNAKECGGLSVCPTGALSWNEEKETIEIDNEKCISCGMCERECPIGAIKVAKSEEEYRKIEGEYEKDPRKTKDLFVDRYGAAPLSERFIAAPETLKEKTHKSDIVLIELYNDESIECLIKSIPVKELIKDLPDSTFFYKIECNDLLKKQYQISTLPSLLLFKNNELVGKIEGYYCDDKKNEIIERIENILK